MLACGALLVAAAVAASRWRHFSIRLPPWALESRRGPGTALRTLVWFWAVGILTGLLVGVFVVGPAGRLVMRLLALTSPEAHGVRTEADQVIGEIMLTGTLGFFVFAGLPFGLGVGLIYALTSFVLPRGPFGGAIFGAAVLVIFGSALDPLREDNPDFDILGPGWLAVTAYSVMAVLTGMLTAPIAGRVGVALGAPKLWWTVWLLPLSLIAAAGLAAAPVILGVVLVGCALFVGGLLVPTERRDLVWSRGKRTLQAGLAATVVVAVPGFISAVGSIVA